MPTELAALPIGEGGGVGGSTEQTLPYALQHISPAAGDVRRRCDLPKPYKSPLTDLTDLSSVILVVR